MNPLPYIAFFVVWAAAFTVMVALIGRAQKVNESTEAK
jgi:hypothetical protein